MEGPSIREYPRMVLDKPVELRVGDKRVQVKEASNLSVGGVHVEGQPIPVGTEVKVKIAARPPVGAEGVIRYAADNGGKGVGIEFTKITDANRQHLDKLIEDITRKGAPVC